MTGRGMPMSRGYELRCPLCAGAGRTAIERGSYSYVRCAGCRSLWLWPVPTKDDLRAYYDCGEFYDGAERALHEQEVLAAGRLERLESMVAGRRLLDVGCASGNFLERAGRRGWDAKGMEPSAALAARARGRGLDVVHVDTLAQFPAEEFDVVTAWEVVEHVGEPKPFLRELSKRVRLGGVIALSTPDAASLAAKLLGASFPFASAPEHLYVFSRTALERMLEEEGLSILTWRAFSGLNTRAAAQMLRKRFGKWATAGAPIVAGAFALLDRLQNGTECEVFATRTR